MMNEPGQEPARLLSVQRAAFEKDRSPSRAARVARLDRLLKLVDDHETEIAQAIDADFGGRSSHETRLAELFVVRGGIRHARAHVGRWMAPRRVPTALHFLPARNELLAQPLGVVGIVSPWNYPVLLSLGPALAALAAGNRVVIKPSESTPAFADLLQRLVRTTFPEEELAVATGGADVGRAFVGLPFDHLFFTGSTAVGRQVAQAAAANLVPVTLELGGKSPAIVDASCDLDEAAPRLAYGKLLNAGQTCIAPDYVLVPEGRADALVDRLSTAIARMYPTLAGNPDYTAIVSARHRARLVDLVADARSLGARIVEVKPAGESIAPDDRRLAPTIVLGANRTMRVMQEEIFGPVLPIVEVRSLDDALAFVNAGDRPLALYWFGRDATNRDRVLAQTHAGGVTINDCLWHMPQEHQPFGGIGASGMGAYHGKWGFDTFSHRKPVFHQARFNGGFMLRPPYGATFERLLGVLKRVT